MDYDIVPDIHGQFDKLQALLAALGWRKTFQSWAASSTNRKLIFLGDFIDRGPDNRKVLQTVRDLVAADLAVAVMGNHELNALRMHHVNEEGLPYRERKPDKLSQHASFLSEFYFAREEAEEWLRWFADLPLFLELPGLRIVHACWSRPAIAKLRSVTEDGRLPKDLLLASAQSSHVMHEAINLVTKGPEYELPKDRYHIDNRGFDRQQVRLKWWIDEHRDWRETMTAAADNIDLSDLDLIGHVKPHAYAADQTPVIFGHYVMPKPVELDQTNTLCLDRCSASKDPLIGYQFREGDAKLNLKRLIIPI